MDDAKLNAMLGDISLRGATPANLRENHGDDLVDFALLEGYARRRMIQVRETNAPGQPGSPPIETIELTEAGKRRIGLA